MMNTNRNKTHWLGIAQLLLFLTKTCYTDTSGKTCRRSLFQMYLVKFYSICIYNNGKLHWQHCAVYMHGVMDLNWNIHNSLSHDDLLDLANVRPFWTWLNYPTLFYRGGETYRNNGTLVPVLYHWESGYHYFSKFFTPLKNKFQQDRIG